jgi:hypothetical protein
VDTNEFIKCFLAEFKSLLVRRLSEGIFLSDVADQRDLMLLSALFFKEALTDRQCFSAMLRSEGMFSPPLENGRCAISAKQVLTG